MKSFINEEFLLSNMTSRKLYHEYAEKIPIYDYHCHINPQEIAEDVIFKNITELWLKADHYKWRLMRSNGVEEYYITGNASDWEKFEKWTQCLERAIGNPLYLWSHLELKRYFGYSGVLNSNTAKEVWELCNNKIINLGISARTLIRQSKVAVIGTTDDPVDDLHWHQEIACDKDFKTRVLPMWRPDKALGIEKADFLDYIAKLSKVSGMNITTFPLFKLALKNRLDFFEASGCKGSDHGMLFLPYEIADDQVIETIFNKKVSGEGISYLEELQFKTSCMQFLGKEYAKRNWVMQIHVGVTRNNNTRMFQKIGADTGFDGIYNRVPIEQMSAFLNALDMEGLLPKTIIYSLNPNDNAAIGTLIGCFQNEGIKGKLQQGAAWWFNDHEAGMKEQMISLANVGVLGNFIGMLTDSRSFLSYTRHEYFRRILCELIGSWIESGRYPEDLKYAGQLVEDICCNNVIEYFGF